MQGSPEGRKELDHPVIGMMVLEHTTFQIHDDPDLKLVLFTPLPEAETPAKLLRLAELPASTGLLRETIDAV